jgi:hypothetical protein
MKKVLIALLSLVLASATAFAQYQVKGVVEDALGPVIGATVMEVGTTNGVSTGLDGDFVLTVSGADAKVEVSCIGYASQVFPASAVPEKILLGEDSTFLDEVVEFWVAGRNEGTIIDKLLILGHGLEATALEDIIQRHLVFLVFVGWHVDVVVGGFALCPFFVTTMGRNYTPVFHRLDDVVPVWFGVVAFAFHFAAFNLVALS